tara:strand:+ start:390 stop:659 length:270 start_codon:yes stop_codon:yes gene_type:complete
MSIWNAFTCWYEGRNKLGPGIDLPTTVKEEPDFTIKLLQCSGCFRYLKDEKQYIKKATIGNKHLYGFCHEDCYNEWLKNPQYKLLGKIN